MSLVIVDEKRCTRCKRCTIICPMGIIAPANKHATPTVQNDDVRKCIQCGHCEVFCPTQALLLNIRPETRETVPADVTPIAATEMATHIKQRRSVRHFRKEPLPREQILALLDIARHAPSASNGQPVRWLVIHDKTQVRTIAGLTADWLKAILPAAPLPLREYLPGVLAAWDRGFDVVCRGAPHLLVAHIPTDYPAAFADAVIALTQVDIAAPAFGLGTCWAGFVAMAAAAHAPLQQELDLPAGRQCGHAMMLGYPRFQSAGIPRRNPLEVIWR